MYSSQFWRLEVLDRGSAWPDEGLLSSHRHLIVSSHGGRDEGALWGLYYKDTNLFMRVPPLWTKYRQRLPLLTPLHWALKCQNIHFVGTHPFRLEHTHLYLHSFLYTIFQMLHFCHCLQFPSHRTASPQLSPFYTSVFLPWQRGSQLSLFRLRNVASFPMPFTAGFRCLWGLTTRGHLLHLGFSSGFLMKERKTW